MGSMLCFSLKYQAHLYVSGDHTDVQDSAL